MVYSKLATIDSATATQQLAGHDNWYRIGSLATAVLATSHDPPLLRPSAAVIIWTRMRDTRGLDQARARIIGKTVELARQDANAPL